MIRVWMLIVRLLCRAVQRALSPPRRRALGLVVRDGIVAKHHLRKRGLFVYATVAWRLVA